MSKAFGQVTSVLGPAERANAQDYRREYTTSFASFTDYLEQLVENKDLDGLYVLFARVDGRFSYLSSELRRKLDGPRTHQQELEIQRILRFVTQLNVAARNLGGDTAINRLFVMRNAIRNMVEDELAQGLQLRAADEAQTEQPAVAFTLTDTQQRAIEQAGSEMTRNLSWRDGALGQFIEETNASPVLTLLYIRMFAREQFLDAAGESNTVEARTLREYRSQTATKLAELDSARFDDRFFEVVQDEVVKYMSRKRLFGDARTWGSTLPSTTPAAPKTTARADASSAFVKAARVRIDNAIRSRITTYPPAVEEQYTPERWLETISNFDLDHLAYLYVRVTARMFQLHKDKSDRGLSDAQDLREYNRLGGRKYWDGEGPDGYSQLLTRYLRNKRGVSGADLAAVRSEVADRFVGMANAARQATTPAPAAPRAPAAPPPPPPTTQFRPGEVQGEFLLPGGSTLTAEQRRLRRLQDYADSLTDEKARERANEFLNFYKSIYAPAPTSDRWQEVDNDFVYVATMLCPRSDPLGRFLLCDIMVNPDDENYPYKVQLFLSGTMQKPAGMGISGAKGLLMGSGYSNEALKTINGKKYSRAHTPGGVIVKRVGLGTVLYSAHSLIGAVYRGAAGCYSDGGSASAEAWWREARLRGYAQPSNKFIAKYCAEVKDNRVADGNKTGRIVFPEEICGDVTALPDAYDRWIDYETVLASGLVVFGVIERGDTFAGSLQFPVKAKHRPFWDTLNVQTGPVNPPGADIFTEWTEDGGSGVYASTGESGLKMALSAETAEMLSRSFHGQSPVLAASIIEALTQSGFDDLAVNYATRADIAPLLAGNPTLKRLLESRSLPGVAGLSNIRYTKLMKAVGLAGLGQATVDMGEKNPLGFKPLSDKTKRMLAKFKDMD